MSAKAIYEATGKRLLNEHLDSPYHVKNDFAFIPENTSWDGIIKDNPWLNNSALVVKPDQLIKRRGQLGLIKINADISEVQAWVDERMLQLAKVGPCTGRLRTFIVEPFLPHNQDCSLCHLEWDQWLNVPSGSGDIYKYPDFPVPDIEPGITAYKEDEAYVCIYSHRYADTILFYHQGGIDVGDVDSKACLQRQGIVLRTPFLLKQKLQDNEKLVFDNFDENFSIQQQNEIMNTHWCTVQALRLDIPIDSKPTYQDIKSKLLQGLPPAKQSYTAEFILSLYEVYITLYFTYLEINPLVLMNSKAYVLDLAAKLDSTAEFVCKSKWGNISFPPAFGRDAYPEEAYIADLDSKSGASLKLTILNKRGRIWTMVAGGGASVIYSDTICELGGASELANYGEYSGAPTEQQTYEYAKTILGLMTEENNEQGKILIIGGGIANFTNVAATFKGIVSALSEFQEKLIAHKVSIFVRRAGPNYQEGLRVMREVGGTLGVPIHVFGPETHMTAIVAMAMGITGLPETSEPTFTTANFLLPTSSLPSLPPLKISRTDSCREGELSGSFSLSSSTSSCGDTTKTLFSNTSKSIVWGMQTKAVQGMLDFDFVCGRKEASVVAMVYPMVGDHKQKYYYGHKEILMPVYKNMKDAMRRHKDADVMINFASLRSAYDSTLETMTYPQIKAIAIIAEGIPENMTRKMIKIANEKKVTIIGPATVGGIKPGCFKIGNTGGMMDNILASKLYRPGCVAYVSRSGGMSNELNNIISRATNGVYEGVAIGGDRYPGTVFMDHLLRFQQEPDVKMLVLLGEVGGIEEYEVCAALMDGRITKPLVAWCIGTCAKMFTSEVQFGHAGSCANSDKETAIAKNLALSNAGALVPDTFDNLGTTIRCVYEDLVEQGEVIILPDVPPPAVPMDYNWARELGLIRKPASFMTSICDERGQELLYAGTPITTVIREDIGIGGVLGLLWFQRRLPVYAGKFLEMVLMVTADHGPAVSGAHNTIVCARAGKDLVSSVVSGLLTIGERFGGALDEAARQYSEAYDKGEIPMDFVQSMRQKGQLIMGIGHRVKSINNPDKRVEILKSYVKENFPCTTILDYALEIEKITTSKKPNLILNVDGCIGAAVVDLLRNSGCFTREEADEYIEIGALNGMFVLGRTVGFIGHYLDQKRLKQGLYRHPWDDIAYVLPEATMDES